MLKEEEVVAQSYATLSIFGQAIHVKRIPLMVLAFVFYLFVKNPVHAFVFYVVLLVLVVRFMPIYAREKDRLLPFILWKYLRKGVLVMWKYLNKLIIAFINLMFVGIVMAQEQIDILGVPEKDLKKMVEELRRKERILVDDAERREKLYRQQEELEYGGELSLVLKGVNFFDYHPDMPVLFVFDRNIRHVLMWTGSAQAQYEGNVLFVGPPAHEDGRVFGFAVILEDGNAYYFAGRKVSITDKTRRVGLYYRLTSPQIIPADELIEVFLRTKGRCPVDGEAFEYKGKAYKFVKLRETIVRDKDEVFCSGSVFRLMGL